MEVIERGYGIIDHHAVVTVDAAYLSEKAG
jgi:hypothetical protein